MKNSERLLKKSRKYARSGNHHLANLYMIRSIAAAMEEEKEETT